MMRLGLVSAILPEFSLQQVLEVCAEEKYPCVELMCWPPGKSERRYAGVNHIDVTSLSAAAIDKVRDLVASHRVSISGLSFANSFCSELSCASRSPRECNTCVMLASRAARDSRSMCDSF